MIPYRNEIPEADGRMARDSASKATVLLADGNPAFLELVSNLPARGGECEVIATLHDG